MCTFISLQARQASDLARCVVVGHLHVERGAGVAEILSGEDGALLADQEGGRVGVAADVVLEHGQTMFVEMRGIKTSRIRDGGRMGHTYGADTEISNLQALDAVHVETLIEHTMLDDRVTLAGCH